MNTHLSSQEFVNALDSVLPATRQAHLVACASCRAEVEALRALMADVSQAAEVHEPSPLFWDHFQSRVQTAVQAEMAVPARAWWSTFASARSVLAAAATVAMVVVGVELYRRDSIPPADSAVEADAVLADTTALEDGPMAIDAAEWEFVSSMMGTLEQDDVRDVLAPSRHAVDAAFDALTTAERDAFMKLLAAGLAEGTE